MLGIGRDTTRGNRLTALKTKNEVGSKIDLKDIQEKEKRLVPRLGEAAHPGSKKMKKSTQREDKEKWYRLTSASKSQVGGGGLHLIVKKATMS